MVEYWHMYTSLAIYDPLHLDEFVDDDYGVLNYLHKDLIYPPAIYARRIEVHIYSLVFAGSYRWLPEVENHDAMEKEKLDYCIKSLCRVRNPKSLHVAIKLESANNISPNKWIEWISLSVYELRDAGISVRVIHTKPGPIEDIWEVDITNTFDRPREYWEEKIKDSNRRFKRV
jgi:hypothetical protein